jgi:hypothetical protein
MGGSPSAPATPDYVGAAQATGAANLEAAVASGHINNPNVVNPYGSQTVTWNGQDPTLTQTLSPEQQAIYDKSSQAKSSMLDAGLGLSDALKNNLSSGLDFSGLPAAPTSANNTRNDVIDATMSRINTDTAGQRDAKNSELIAAGIRPGTAAYQTAMTQIDRGYNDARQQAILGAGQQAAQDYSQNMGTRQQAINELMAQRETPLNEANALVTGAQVSSPFSGGLGYQAGANVQGTNYLQATQAQGQASQNQYNNQQAQYNNNVSAGAGLIGSIGSAYLGK